MSRSSVDPDGTSSSRYLAAVVQLSSTSDIAANWAQARPLVEQAAAAGARLIATPENAPWLGPIERKADVAQAADGPIAERWSRLAKRLGIHLLLGSMVERGPTPAPGHPQRSYNTSLLFGPDGRQIEAYRKIHLFDVDLPPEVVFRESEAVQSGGELAVASTPLGRIGLSICYDLRFGELYRGLVERGAEILTVPSAFTARTGKAHWQVLLRARAIETQCWVLAPAQVGLHDDDGIRHSHGHSMIVDPWGEVVAEVVADEPGFALAEIDPARVSAVRKAMPVQAHRRLGAAS